jgi:hypothetical protein
MLPDRLWRGLFHRHIMASGGRTARSDKTVQPDSDRKLSAMLATPTAETQTVGTVALRDSSMLQVYGPAPNRAVPECTGTQSTRNAVTTAVAANTGDSRCAVENNC